MLHQTAAGLHQPLLQAGDMSAKLIFRLVALA
jgi:hypothetical protein